MTKTITKNEIIKREYFNHCRSAQGFAESTIKKYAQCIYKWQECFEGDDFVHFSKEKCDNLKKYLKVVAEKNNTTLSNQYDILRHLKKFFLWLSEQPGYEKIKKTDLDYLRLSKKETSIALERKDREYPTLKEIQKIVYKIPSNTEIEMRDRSFIAFLALTGMRISAAITLPIQSFDPIKFCIEQSPRYGVKTKNSKKILSTFLPIDWDDGEKIFLDWFSYLVNMKKFTAQKPMFPANKNFSLRHISDQFWQSSNPARKIIQERCKEADVPYYNPHSFRHAAVAIVSEKGLTESDKRAISLVLGHENIGTTFGAHSYGSLTPQEAVKRVHEMKNKKTDNISFSLSDEDLGKALRKVISESQK